MAAFFLQGFCQISSGIIVSILLDRYHFSYGFSGTLISLMSIGNMIALFIAGILPERIGEKATALLFSGGYFLGYLIMGVTGLPFLLLSAFFLAGIGKGCTADKCTVLVGNNTADRPRALSLMNAWFALGALLCPFMITALQRVGDMAPVFGVSAAGIVLWAVFLAAGLPGKKEGASGERKHTDYSFLKNPIFWILACLVLCENAAEYTVNGWLVTFYKNERIIAGAAASYSVTVQWGATLIARLALAFAIKLKKPYKALSVMGIAMAVTYAMLLMARSTVPALICLSLFSIAVAGVYPLSVACVGEMMSSASVGILLSIGGLGGIVVPWIVGIIADAAGLRGGMAVNLVPCLGIIILPVILTRIRQRH